MLGKLVCQKAFCSIYHFSHGKLQRAKQHILSSQLQAPDHGNLASVHVSEGVLYAHAWFASYISTMGDRMPNSSEVHLPCSLRWKDLFTSMAAKLAAAHLPSCSRASFQRLLATHFSHVMKLRKTRLGKCDTCIELP